MGRSHALTPNIEEAARRTNRAAHSPTAKIALINMDQRRFLSSPAWEFFQRTARLLTKSGCISERCGSRADACPVRYGGIQRARWVNRHTTPLALYNRTGSVTRTPPPPYTTAGYRLPLQQARRLPICGPPVASATMAETVKNTVFPKKNVKSCVDISKDSKVQHLEVDLRYTVYRVYDTPCVTHPRRCYKGGAGVTTPPPPL